MAVRDVSLLRGINVGGHNLIAMARLRAIYEALGCRDVETYLQSGNVVFRHRDGPALGPRVEQAIRAELGLDIRILWRSHADLVRIVAADPFPEADPSRRLVVFLSEPPAPEVAHELHHVRSGPDEAILFGAEFHLHCPAGVGTSKLPAMLSERRLGVVPTGRNWRTVTRLRDLSAEPA